MVIYRDMYYPPADSTRKLHIYLPDGYDNSEERYPVMYFFDGHNLFFDEMATYGKSWGLKSFLDGWEKPVIIVGMECCHEGQGRLDEYCPYPRTMFGHRIKPLGEATFQWIINDIKPMIDGWLRTWPHREATGIAGSSMGGIMSLYGAIAHNDVFGKAAPLSTGLRWSGKRLREELDRSPINADTRIFLSWGELEGGRMRAGGNPETDSAEARATWKMVDALQERGINTRVHCNLGAGHNEAAWEREVPSFMNFLGLDR